MKKPEEIFDLWSIAKEKAVNELDAVECLLQNLNIDASTLASTGPNNTPDCVLEIRAAKFGIEVTGLIDRPAREKSAKARKKNVKARGKSIGAKGEKELPEYYAEWSKNRFQAALKKLVVVKEEKIRAAKAAGKAASLCEKFWLVVHADEVTLTSPYVQDFVSGWSLSSDVFERIFLILSYEPGRIGDGYPYFQLK